jgi:prefoldin subunit 5
MQQENEKLTATIQDLQSQANDLARVNGNMRTKLESLFNSDETVKKLRAEHDSLEKEEQKLPVLERRKDIFLQLETLGKEYQLK